MTLVSYDSTSLVTGWLARLPGPLEPESTVPLLRRNKYPLLSLDLERLPAGLVASPAFKEALEEDRQSLASQREEFLPVQQAWLQRGIPCLFVKTACVPPSFPYSSDNLDVLVPRALGEEAKDVLRQLGHVELRNVEEPSKFLFRKYRGGRSVSAIHVHYWVGWNIDFFEEDRLWERAHVAEDDPQVLAPRPEDALLINLAHAFYENKRFSLHDLEKMRVNWHCHSLDWEYLTQVAQRSGWYDGLLLGLLVGAHLEESLTGGTGAPEALRQRWAAELARFPIAHCYYRRLLQHPVVMPFKVSFAVSKLMYYQKIQHDTHDRFRSRLSNTVRTLAWGIRLKSGIRPRPGMLVTLSGMDGSGKTSHAEALMQVLQTSDIKASYHWHRVGCSFPARLAARVASRLSRRQPAAASQRTPARDRLRDRSGVVKCVWAWTNVLALALEYTWKARMPLLLGKLGLGWVVVCDRYVPDDVAEVLVRIPRPGWTVRAALAFLRWVSQRPHLAYILTVDAEVAKARHVLPVSLDDLREYQKLYLTLAGQTGGHPGVHAIDAQQDFNDVNNRLVVEVLRAFEARYPTWLNACLLSNPSQFNPPKG